MEVFLIFSGIGMLAFLPLAGIALVIWAVRCSPGGNK
jgi:hypothetical protein